MAMQLNKVLDSGFSVTYWKIGSIEVDFINKIVIVNVLGYKDKESRDLNLKSVISVLSTITDPFFSSLILSFSSDIRSSVYLVIKNSPEWAGELDVI